MLQNNKKRGKKEMNKQNWLMLCIVLTLITLIALPLSVKAFGITSAYYSENPLRIQPGETKTISFSLTNMVGNQNLTVIANITKGAEIAHLVDPVDKQYFVPLGTNNNVGISLTVTAPATDPIGKQYEVEVTVTTVTPGTGGGVVFGSSIGKEIPVVIVSPTGEIIEKKTLSTELVILIVLIILVIIAIIIIILGMKKKKSK